MVIGTLHIADITVSELYVEPKDSAALVIQSKKLVGSVSVHASRLQTVRVGEGIRSVEGILAANILWWDRFAVSLVV